MRYVLWILKFALFVVVWTAAAFGSERASANLAPTFVYIAFWVGMVVVTIVGILAGIAMVQVKNMQRKARETALMDNLYSMRKAIDNFYADKQRFPASLDELVPDYLRKIPPDPITDQTDWETVVETPDPDAPQETDEFGSPAAPGVIDVKSKAPGNTLNGTPYTEL